MVVVGIVDAMEVVAALACAIAAERTWFGAHLVVAFVTLMLDDDWNDTAAGATR